MTVAAWSSIRQPILVGVGLLCLCILMQSLGVPITLWNPSWGDEALQTSVLEGFSMISSVLNPWSMKSGLCLDQPSGRRLVTLLDRSLFHPPDA